VWSTAMAPAWRMKLSKNRWRRDGRTGLTAVPAAGRWGEEFMGWDWVDGFIMLTRKIPHGVRKTMGRRTNRPCAPRDDGTLCWSPRQLEKTVLAGEIARDRSNLRGVSGGVFGKALDEFFEAAGARFGRAALLEDSDNRAFG